MPNQGVCRNMGVICSCLTFCFFCVKTKERVVVLAQHLLANYATNTTIIILGRDKMKSKNADVIYIGVFLGAYFNFYRSLITLYFGTNDFITSQAIKYATAQIANMML